MRSIAFLATVTALLALSGCRVRSYVRTPGYETVTVTCDPNYPCSNTYYWDEWREVYVYYDGYRYWDATGMHGAYPVPAPDVICYAPPYGYVPPSNFRPPRGTYRAPHGYRSPNYDNPNHGTAPVTPRGAEPRPPSGNAWGQPPPPGNARPPSGNAYGPPAGSAPPPSGSGWGPPSSGSAPPPPSGSGWAPPSSGSAPPPSGNAYVPPVERTQRRGGFFEPPAPTGGLESAAPPSGNSFGGRSPVDGHPHGHPAQVEAVQARPPLSGSSYVPPAVGAAPPPGNPFGGRGGFVGQNQNPPQAEPVRQDVQLPDNHRARPPLREVPHRVDLPPVPNEPLPTRDPTQPPSPPKGNPRMPVVMQPSPGQPTLPPGGPGFPPPMR